MGLDRDLISLSHNADDFLIPATRNYAASGERVINDISLRETLKNHLVATALVRIDDRIAGMATGQELLYLDPYSGRMLVNSMWLIRLNEPRPPV